MIKMFRKWDVELVKELIRLINAEDESKLREWFTTQNAMEIAYFAAMAFEFDHLLELEHPVRETMIHNLGSEYKMLVDK